MFGVFYLILFFPVVSNAGEIHEHVKQRDLKKVTSYLEQGGNPNALDNNGYPPLYWAITNNSTDIARLLIKYQADVNMRVKHTVLTKVISGDDRRPERHTGTCVLLFAIPSLSSEALQMVELLLNAGAHVNAQCHNNNTLLHEAAFFKYLDLIKLLLKPQYKAHVSPGNWNGTTPLHTAVRLKYKEIVRFLIEKRANVNARGDNNNTPLHTAAFARHPDKEIIELLVINNADVNIRNSTNLRPIDIAKERGHPPDIQRLLQKRNRHSESPADEDRR